MFQIFGIIGLLFISYGIWVRNEKNQDIWFIFGGLSMLVYSVYVGNLIFIILQIIFIFSSAIELIRLRGR